jgi:effector-binding domain-containing protein
MNIEQINLPKTTYVGMTTTIKMAEMKNNPFFMETYSAVGAHAGKTNQALGTAVAIYKSWDMQKGEAETFVGFSVEDDFDVGSFERFEVDSGNAMTLMHMGSYDGLGESHQKVMAAMKEASHVTKLAIEEYMNNPNEVDESELQTRIIYTY